MKKKRKKKASSKVYFSTKIKRIKIVVDKPNAYYSLLS